MEKIKVIWDFRGEEAHQIALHHEQHLAEYAQKTGCSPGITGSEKINDFYSLAFLVVMRDDMISVRDALRPHRAEIYQ